MRTCHAGLVDSLYHVDRLGRDRDRNEIDLRLRGSPHLYFLFLDDWTARENGGEEKVLQTRRKYVVVPTSQGGGWFALRFLSVPGQKAFDLEQMGEALQEEHLGVLSRRADEGCEETEGVPYQCQESFAGGAILWHWQDCCNVRWTSYSLVRLSTSEVHGCVLRLTSHPDARV